MTVLTVADGHGKNGHVASIFACKNMPYYILDRLRQGSASTPQLLKDTFNRINQEICCLLPPESSGGTTCVTAIIDGTKLSIANIGDSKAVIFKRTLLGTKPRKSTLDDNFENLPLSKWEEMIQSGRVFFGYYNKRLNTSVKHHFTGLINSSGFHLSYIGIKGHKGLNMTGSLGDSRIKIPSTRHPEDTLPISSIPKTYEWDISDQDTFLVLASDGLWGFTTPDEIGIRIDMLLNRGIPYDQIAPTLANFARNRKGSDDDIVIIVKALQS